MSTGLNLKEQVKKGTITVGDAINKLSELGVSRDNRTYKWLLNRKRSA